MARNRDLDAILKAFDAIPKAARASVGAAIHKGADEMVSKMKSVAPEKTGRLKRSIKKRAISDVAVRVEAGGEETTVPVRNGQTASFDYALGQEYGTEDTPASPFFWGPVNTLKKRVRRRVDRSISKAVKDAWGGK